MPQGKMPNSISGYESVIKISLGTCLCMKSPYGLQPALSGPASQELLANLHPYLSKQSYMIHSHHTWQHWTDICKFPKTYPLNKMSSKFTN